MGESGMKPEDAASARDARLRPLLLSLALVMVAAYILLIAAPNLGFDDSFLKILLISAIGLGCGVSAFLMLRPDFSSLRRRASDEDDPLSHVGKRPALFTRLDKALEEHAEAGRQLALHIVDIDRFHVVNQVAGEAVGTALLGHVAARLLGLVDDESLVCRIGDDEFAVIQPETGGARHAEIYGRRILDAVHEACAEIASEIRPSASVGIAVSPGHGTEAERLMRNASLALDAAKEAGGTFRLYARDMEMAVEARRRMEKAITEGLEEGWFELHYQPQYDLATRRLTGFEALVRMNHPQLGFLMPNVFLPAAEEGGLMPRLGDWIVREAIATAANWPDHLSLAINVSDAQIRNGDLAGTVLAALDATHLDAGNLRLEISEGVLASPNEETLDQLRRLKARRVMLVIDDFGLASSNLQAITQTGCNAIKIDRSLMQHVGEDAEAEGFVRSLIRTAQSFGLAVHAEGIERAEQVLFLVTNECRNVQGFLFGRPAHPSEVAAIIAKDIRKTVKGDEERRGHAAA